MTKPQMARQMFLRARDKLRIQPTLQEMVARSRMIRETPYGRIDGNGVNVSMIEELLKLSPEERVRRGEERARRAIAARRMGPGVH